MRVAFLVAAPASSPSSQLWRHAQALAHQFRRNGQTCDLWCSDDLAALVSGPRCDVLHIFHALDGCRVAGTGWLPSVPTVVHVHPAEGAIAPLAGPVGQVDRIDALITPSLALAQELGGRWPRDIPVNEIPLGLTYSPAARRAAPPDGQGASLQVAIAGQIEGVDWPGVQARLPMTLVPWETAGGRARVDLVVAPSLHHGACSYRALEAVAAGCLLLVPSGPGAREFLGRYRCGLPYPEGDRDALLSRLAMLCEQPQVVRAMQADLGFPEGIEEEAFWVSQLYARLTRPGRPAGSGRWLSPPAWERRLKTSLVAWGIIRPSEGDTVPREALVVAGWAVLDGGPVVRVDVALNGRAVGPARLGLDRPEIARDFPSAEAAVSGFEIHLDLTDIPEGVTRAILELTIHAFDGSAFPIGPVAVELAQRYRLPDEALRRLGSRGSPGPPALGPPGAPEVRLVAFAHDLGYGGAQLYLWEMLRLLAREPWFSCTVVAPGEGPLASDLEGAGLRVHVTSGYPLTSIDLYEGKQAELAAWMAAQGFNVVFANTLVAFPGVDVASRIGLPSVWAIHESYTMPVFWQVHLPPTAPIHPYVAGRAEQALERASALVFEVEATRRMFERTDGSRTCLTVPYGVPIEDLAAYRAEVDVRATRRQLGIPEGATVLLCLGTMQSRKAQTVVAQAFNEIADSHPDVFLVYVGDLGDSYANCLRLYLDRAGLLERCLMAPVVADPLPWYAVADLLISASDIESLPRSVIEAMALDVPVLATRVFGLPELIEDGRTGFLCEPRDLKALSETLDFVLTAPPAYRKAIGQAGGRSVQERNDSTGYARELGALLRRLVAHIARP